MFSRILQSILFAVVISLNLGAQAQTSLSHQDKTGKINILIERQFIRFIAPQEAQEWRLEVANQQGAMVFDSGWVYGNALEWSLHDSQALPSGLYAYTLTSKTAFNQTPRTQRGHVIIDRASNNDRIWLTSSPAVGIGAGSEAAQVTVVGSTEATLGGVELPGRKAGAERKEAPTQGQVDPTTETPVARTAAPSGTPNQVAKFAGDGVSLIDSAITETGGNVGIGTTTPQSGLDYRNSGASFFTRDIGPNNAITAQSALQLGLTNGGSRFAGVGPSFLFFADNTAGAKSFLGRVSGVWENPTAGAETGAILFQVRANSSDTGALTERMRIMPNGNVGIGTSTPTARLEVRGDIRLGFSGQYRAVAGEENLRIIRGVVDGAGNIIVGSGFTATRTGTGLYTINFTTGFSGPPAIMAAAEQDTQVRTINTAGVTATSANFRTYFGTGLTDVAFHFIAVGPR